jgi:glycosyltransferase involved in cell wall biosynthesis
MTVDNFSQVSELKILFTTSDLNCGGKQKQLIETARVLKNEGVKIGLITFNRDQYYSQSAIEIFDYYYEVNKKGNKIAPFFKVWKIIHHHKPLVIHTWDAFSTFLILIPAKILNISIVNGSIRDVGVDKGLRFLAKRILLCLSDHIISNSQAGLFAYKTQGTVLHNVIDTKRFSPKAPVGDFNIVMVAGFTRYKDHFTFLKASETVVKNGTIDGVYLVGDGPFLSNYKKMVESFGKDCSSRFHFPGNIDDVENVLSQCKIGILCSTKKYSEGLSNAVLEYMAAGMVPVVTDIGAMRELIRNDINGFLVSPEEANELATVIMRLKSDPVLLNRVSMNARNTLVDHFSFSSYRKGLFNFYQDVLVKRKVSL